MAANDIVVPRENAQGQFEELVLPDATTSARGLLSSSDKTKLDGIAAGAEVNVNADWNASSGDAQILNKPTLGGAAALNVGTTTGTVAAGDDARLSDARTPTSHTHAASDITSGSFGNISFDGKLGTTAGLPVVTTTAGAVTTLALGTAGQVLTVNGTADGVEFAAASGGGFGEVRFDTSGSYTYTGQAAAGSPESSAVWFIRRSEFSSAGAYVSTTTANNVEWDDRLTASYS